MESNSEKQKTLVGVFHDLPETLKAWEVVKKVASGNGEVISSTFSLNIRILNILLLQIKFRQSEYFLQFYLNILCLQKYSYDCELILFDELLEINKGSRFCNADVAVVDFSVREQCADLSYNLGGNSSF